MVGVRWQPLERQVAELTGTRPHPYIPLTLSTSIGYLRPEKKYLEVRVASERDAGDAARQVVQLLALHGEPFIQEHSTSAAVRQALETGQFVVKFHADYRLPVLSGLIGDHQAARATAEAALDERRDRTDPEAVAYRTFVGSLKEWLRTTT